MKHFHRFRDKVCWDILTFLQDEKVLILEREIFDRMFYSVLPFRIWCHFWCCIRSQFDPNVCQFCTKLQTRDKKIVNYIYKKLVLDVRKDIPIFLYSTVTYNREISLFAHVQFGPDRERPYTKTIMVCCTMRLSVLHLGY